MKDWLLIAGAVIAFGGMFFHGVVGQRKYMGNINNSELEARTKSLSLVSWHMFTIFLFVSGVTLVLASYSPHLKAMCYPIIFANFLGAVLFIFLGFGRHNFLLNLPGAYLMGFTALFGFLGVYL